ncbi:hypothetical protein B0H14DRAFT_3786908 [Mycena olivaceomarginata]|nr:hypothetical protein B0H14DRAFT_3786908 [Mycena olivaceomarginata]
MSAMVSQRKSSLLSHLLFGALLTNLGATALLIVTRSGPVNMHIANLVLQSSASFFTHMHVYDKTDNPVSFTGYTRLVAESAAPVAAGSGGVFGFLERKKDGAGAGWTELGSVAGLERWALDLGLLRQGEEGAGMLERAQGVLRLEERPRL